MAQASAGPRAPRIGTVTEFDEPRGLGTVRSDDGASYRFHCTAIAGGTRVVAVGERVVFSVVAGHGGHYEARAVTAIAAG
jgi:cold shock CspA family protein